MALFRRRGEVLNNSTGGILGWESKIANKALSDKNVERISSGLLQKGWRALLFANRKGLTPKILGNPARPKGLHDDYSSVSDIAGRNKAEFEEFPIVSGRRILVGRDLKSHNIGLVETYGITDASSEVMKTGNQVLIINPCVVDKNNNPDVIILQNRPQELEYQPKSSWADIKSMGRNTPFYQYTGSETSIHINISWFLPGAPGGNIPDNLGGGPFNPYWVINQCRKLESWTMANGYAMAPPVLMIRWGTSDLFKDHLWILKSATYKLMDFHDRCLIRNTSNNLEFTEYIKGYNRYIDQGLIPYSATQELIFDRISGINLWYSDISPFRELPKDKYAADSTGYVEQTVMSPNTIAQIPSNNPSPEGTLGNINMI